MPENNNKQKSIRMLERRTATRGRHQSYPPYLYVFFNEKLKTEQKTQIQKSGKKITIAGEK